MLWLEITAEDEMFTQYVFFMTLGGVGVFVLYVIYSNGDIISMNSLGSLGSASGSHYTMEFETFPAGLDCGETRQA